MTIITSTITFFIGLLIGIWLRGFSKSVTDVDIDEYVDQDWLDGGNLK